MPERRYTASDFPTSDPLLIYHLEEDRQRFVSIDARLSRIESILVKIGLGLIVAFAGALGDLVLHSRGLL